VGEAKAEEYSKGGTHRMASSRVEIKGNKLDERVIGRKTMLTVYYREK